MKVVMSSGLTSATMDTPWDVERIPIVAAAPTARTASRTEAKNADLGVSYLPPVRSMTLVLPVSTVLPVTPVIATVLAVVMPVTSTVPPMEPPPTGVMSPDEMTA